MKRINIRFQICIATVLLALFVPRYAKGDGGVIRLRETQGTFSVTVFSSAEGVAGGLEDVSVLVQQKDTGGPVLDADVHFTLSPPDGKPRKQSDEFCGLNTTAMRSANGINNAESVRATREQASNKLLYAAPVKLNTPGDWKLNMLVSRGTDSARFDCLLPVTLSSVKLTGVWLSLSLPPLVIAIFAVNQWLRRQSLQKQL